MRSSNKSLVLSLLASSLLVLACSSSESTEENLTPGAGGSAGASAGGSSAGGSSAGKPGAGNGGSSSGKGGAGSGGAAGGTAGSGAGGSGGSGQAGDAGAGGSDAGAGGSDAGAGGSDAGAGGSDAGAGGSDAGAGGSDAGAGGSDAGAGGSDAGAGGSDAGAGGSDAGAGGSDAGGSDAGGSAGSDAGGSDAGGSDAGGAAGSGAGGSDAGGSDAGGAGGSDAGAAGSDAGGSDAGGSDAGGSAGSDAGGSDAGGSAGSDAGGSDAGGSDAGGAGGSDAGAGGSDAGAGGSDAGAGGSDAGAGGSDAGAGGSDAGAGGSDAGGSDAGGSAGSNAGGSDAGGAAGDGGAGGAGQAGDSGSGGSAGACVTQSAEATLVKKPVDIIFIIDNSGSMSQEIIGVQNNINQNFAQIIENSGLDYRVIMISHHGNVNPNESICVASPLSGHTCPPASNSPPVFTSKFFHYSIEVASTNSLQLAITSFGAPGAPTPKDVHNLAPQGWKEWLRADAVKVFVEVTDDNQTGTTYNAAGFDSKLLALPGGQFGTAQKRNYIFHSIIGVPTKGGDPAAAYLPTDPKVTGSSKCSSAVNNGSTYQDLSILTGGLRFPVCNTASYNAVFTKIAEGVIEGSKVACQFAIPNPEIIDPATIKVEYTPGGGGPVQTFLQVPNLAACAPGKIYVQNDIVNMCPDTCTTVQDDNQAKMDILYGCKIFL